MREYYYTLLFAVGLFDDDCSRVDAWWQLSTPLGFPPPLAIFNRCQQSLNIKFHGLETQKYLQTSIIRVHAVAGTTSITDSQGLLVYNIFAKDSYSA